MAEKTWKLVEAAVIITSHRRSVFLLFLFFINIYIIFFRCIKLKRKELIRKKEKEEEES